MRAVPDADVVEAEDAHAVTSLGAGGKGLPGLVARHPVARRVGLQHGLGRPAVVVGERAAGREGAPGRHVRGIDRQPGDDGERPGQVGLHVRHGRDERPRVRVPGQRPQALRGQLLDDAAPVHDEHPVAHVGHDRDVVADEQEGGAGVAAHLGEQAEDLLLDRDVERGGRLVGDDEPRRPHQPHADHRPLAHAPGELEGVLPGAPFGARGS
ncbi:hypothetical protein GCM10020220_077300 [Nonomuraea rubra]